MTLVAVGCAFLWLTTSGWSGVWAGDEVVTLKIPAKEIPVPSTVSPELQKVIATPIPNTPVPETVEAWKAFAAKFDAVAAENARAFAKAVGAKIEPTTIGGVPCFRITPKVIASECKDRLLVHAHGGAFVLNGGEAATTEATLVADACKTRAISIDYRMPPDHPFPAALDDVVAVWKALLATHDARRRRPRAVGGAPPQGPRDRVSGGALRGDAGERLHQDGGQLVPERRGRYQPGAL
jgi:hypothetical protein